jgi:NAD-dependent DNA ligase
VAIKFDKNGQPEIGIHRANNEIKAINALYGLILGITADKTVNDAEIHFLNLWLLDNEIYTNSFPLNVIKTRINEILEDNIITNEERDDLHQTLIQIIGGDYHETGSASGTSTSYGAEEPDSIIIYGSSFCLTGTFISGPRDKCERTIARFGGSPAKSVTKNLDYLVIGSLPSRDWIAESHGRKFEKALHYKEQGAPLTILTEEHLVKFINF